MKKLSKNLLILLLVFVSIAGLFSVYTSPLQSQEKIDISTLVTQIENEAVESIEVDGDKLVVTLKDGTVETAQKETAESLSSLLANYNISNEQLRGVKISVKEASGLDFFLINILPFLIPFLLIAAFIWFMSRQVQGANNRAMMFGQTRAREYHSQNLKTKVTFKNVAGVEEAKQELREVVDFLRNPKKYLNLGARIPRGVLLIGSPGTGKTLLAKAVAGEAGVPFFNISGSEFVEMFVGVGASRVRDLFRKAKKAAPCILFIDELDAVGRQRGTGLGGSNDEREQTLNQILVEMDGFDETTNVIVLAATNRPDVLDPALLRPGRFDRRVNLPRPDIRGREQILQVHAKKKPLTKEVNLKAVAARTPGFAGADLANLLNEAAILAAQRNKQKIEQQDIFDSIEKVMLGPERRSHIMSDREKKITAYHEAGHALVAHSLPNADPVHKVSIIGRGPAAGYTLKLPEEDKNFHNKSEFLDDMAVMLGGYVTEQEIFGEVTTGASNDLAQATKLARQIITDYGMSETLGPRTFGKTEELTWRAPSFEHRDYSEKMAEAIDKEITGFITRAMKTAQEVIKKKRKKLEKIVKVLLDKETLERDEFEALLKTA
ncbi:MAG: cell division protein FtsH [Candidatus Buchananbacteria bacterium CG10_big_fil_rev_8_21_14_0_10_42_9]|uniref:ATP-dependent zinc metalloprotease FtsH n=1 Tax=Candidatus Buchananbacteria bacterium CG10_big_fil_rev_8_21_14_0_10_42_9 TaxID=1974526 RepID=A0A2H0W152_9BACT|nr:MAG: cell division protein FtsH [Candidatus Buchananbacteria bacterium CG10_big_fil_rev_8_21_14_0_10_42_9]